MGLLDLVPIWVALLSIALGVLGLTALLRCRVIHSIADPNIVAFFQVIFTFFVLLFLGDLLVVDAIGFLMLMGTLLKLQDKRTIGTPSISQEDWISFCKAFAIVLLFLNAYLLMQKGFLLFAEDVSAARVDFYQGWGLFRRFNEIGVGLLSITAAILWHRRQRKEAIAIALLSAYLALTLGSRSGLLACLLAYGAYVHFEKTGFSNRRILLAGAALGLSSLAIFFVMFGPQFLGAFAVRFLGFSDGPVYYFSDHMYRYSNYPITYPFADLLIDLRLKTDYTNLPLGRFINLHHFGMDTPLFGPNPQVFVESHAAFHWLSILWYILIGFLFVFLRKQANTPFSFYLGCFIAGPLLIDSQLAGSQFFTIILLLTLVGIFLSARFVLRQACAGTRKALGASYISP